MTSTIFAETEKVASGEFSELHFGQRAVNRAPQRVQNFLSAAFSKSQLEQRIGLPTEANDRLASCTTPTSQRASGPGRALARRHNMTNRKRLGM